jgi:hypothetical protein
MTQQIQTTKTTKALVVSPRELALELASIAHGMTPIGAETKTTPRVRKTDKETNSQNPYWEQKNLILKSTSLNGFANFNYEKGVNRRRDKENRKADFQAKGNYFVVVTSTQGHLTPLAIHKEDAAKIVGWKFKAEKLADSIVNSFTTEHLKDTDDSTRFYLRISVKSAKSNYSINGNDIPFDEIKPFLYDSSYGKSQGLSKENELPINLYGIDKIKSMRIDKKSFIVRS